ncbi:unnamed protein product [Prunus armeniaca]
MGIECLIHHSMAVQESISPDEPSDEKDPNTWLVSKMNRVQRAWLRKEKFKTLKAMVFVTMILERFMSSRGGRMKE